VDIDKEDWSKIDTWIDTCVAQLSQALQRNRLKSFQDLGGVAAVTGSSGSNAAAAAAGCSKAKPYYARVVSVEGLCTLRNPDDKDTVKLELLLEPEAVAAGGLTYLPGDALGIWPSNPPQVCGGGVRGRGGLFEWETIAAVCRWFEGLQVSSSC
jgi:sulfite reductase alpha subunit-like flavoprotein